MPTTAIPSLPTITHIRVDTQDTASRPPAALGAIFDLVHAEAPSRGSAEVATMPAVSGGRFRLQQVPAVSTHSDADPHDTAAISPRPWTWVTQPATLLVGCADASTRPLKSAATHSDTESHHKADN
jgi:hypothetical protein